MEANDVSKVTLKLQGKRCEKFRMLKLDTLTLKSLKIP